MKEIAKVYGPYYSVSGRNKGRKIIVYKYTDGTTGSVLYSKYLMERHLGRKLDPITERVDHINNDKTDYRIENLQLLTQLENTIKYSKPPEMESFVCPSCKVVFEREARYIRHNQGKHNKAGPFCSRSCAGKYNCTKRVY